MADPAALTTETGAGTSAPGESAFSVVSVSGEMVLLTWATFLAATILLFKLAWKPILQALGKREERIRASLDNAQKAQALAERTREDSRKTLEAAKVQADRLIEEARRTADRAAAVAEQQAREQVRRLLDQADRDIARARAEAVETLRRESAALAVDLADRFLERETPAEVRAGYTERMVRELTP